MSDRIITSHYKRFQHFVNCEESETFAATFNLTTVIFYIVVGFNLRRIREIQKKIVFELEAYVSKHELALETLGMGALFRFIRLGSTCLKPDFLYRVVLSSTVIRFWIYFVKN